MDDTIHILFYSLDGKQARFSLDVDWGAQLIVFQNSPFVGPSGKSRVLVAGDTVEVPLLMTAEINNETT